jgi:hypothetical protein
VTVVDETELPENRTCRDRQSCIIQQHIGPTVVYIDPQQGVDCDWFPPIEGGGKQSRDVGKYESHGVKSHLYEGLSLNSRDRRRVRWRNRIRRGRLSDPCNDIAQAL